MLQVGDGDMPITWRPEIAIDNHWIDEDHRTLIDILNDFERLAAADADVDALSGILLRLKKYSVLHFKREEEMQRRVQYPYLDAHRKEHHDLIKRLRHITEDLSTASEIGKNALAHDIFALLRDWLVNHTLQSDRRIKPFIEDNKAYKAQLEPLASVAVDLIHVTIDESVYELEDVELALADIAHNNRHLAAPIYDQIQKLESIRRRTLGRAYADLRPEKRKSTF